MPLAFGCVGHWEIEVKISGYNQPASRRGRKLMAGTGLATLVAFGLLLPLTSKEAAAACANSPNFPSPTTTINCTGADTNGDSVGVIVLGAPVLGNNADITATMQTGSSITNAANSPALSIALAGGHDITLNAADPFSTITSIGANAFQFGTMAAESTVTMTYAGDITATNGNAVNGVALNGSTVDLTFQASTVLTATGTTDLSGVPATGGGVVLVNLGNGTTTSDWTVTNHGAFNTQNDAVSIYNLAGQGTHEIVNDGSLGSASSTLGGAGAVIVAPNTAASGVVNNNNGEIYAAGNGGPSTSIGGLTLNSDFGGIAVIVGGDATVTNLLGEVHTVDDTGILAIGGIGGAGKATVDSTTGLVESTNASGVIAGTFGSGATLIDAGDVNAGAAGFNLPAPFNLVTIGGGVVGLSNTGGTTVNAHGDIKVAAGGQFGAAAISLASQATLNITGNVLGDTASGGPNIGGQAAVLSGSEDALITVGNGTAPASTVYGVQTGLFALNAGSGDATIDADQLGSDESLNTVNSGGTGLLSVATGSGNATIDAGIINSNQSGTGGVGPLFGAVLSGNPVTIAGALQASGSGAIAFAAGGGDAAVTNYGEITANDGAFGAAAIAFGGNATVTAKANIDPPDIGMFPFSIGSGNAVGQVIDGVTVDSNYVGILAGNIGSGSVRVDVGDDTLQNVGAAVNSGGVGVFLLKDGGADGADGNVITVHENSSVVGDAAAIVISAGLVGGNGNAATINNNGLIQGNFGGVTLPAPLPPIPVLQIGVINSYTDGTLTINNSSNGDDEVGIIQGELSAAADLADTSFTDADLGAFELAIAAGGGAATINNSGVIRGNVALLSNDNNTFNNTNFWNTGGLNLMGGGDADVLNNSALMRTHLVTVFSGLENWNNGGVVDTYDDIANDFTSTDGNFNAGIGECNSCIYIDAALTPGGTADLLAIGAAVDINSPTLLTNTGGNLTGKTQVYVNDLDNGPGQYDPNGVLFALEGGSPDDGGAFYTDGGINKGLFVYDVYRRDAATTQNNQGFTEWVLASTPNELAYELPIVASGANELWNVSTGTWLDRTADLRSAFTGTGDGVHSADLPANIAGPSQGYGAWFRTYGGTQSRDNDITVAAPAGLIGPGQQYDDSYSQNFLGFMTGLDFVREGTGANGKKTAWIFGVTAGYGGSDLDFDGSGSDAKYKAGSVGAYVTYLNGGFFVDGTVKADFGNVKFGSNAGGGDFSGDFGSDYTSVGLVVDTGYRMDMSSGWFLEPKATLSYVSTHFDDANLAGTAVSFDNGDSLKGRLGGRLGRKSDFDGKVIEGFVEANVWDEFDGDYSVNLGGGGFDTDISKDLGGVYGEIAGGVNVISMSNGWSGFAKAAVQFGDDSFLGVMGNLGVRKNF